MLAGIYHIFRTERELGRIMEAAMTAYKAKDFETAARHVRAVAERNDAEAQCLLGVFYAEGRGVEQDYAEAVKWLRKAAKDSKYRKGISGAKSQLGDCYFNGKGVEQDYDKAMMWYRRAADQGNELAMFRIAVCYAEGKGVERDEEKAVRWMLKAAEEGYAAAQCAVGLAGVQGKGFIVDAAEGKWIGKSLEDLRKAAERGNPDAQFYLGTCCLEGVGVEQDRAEAGKWLRKAAESDSPMSERARAKLEGLEGK